MPAPPPLEPPALCRRRDPAALGFGTTEEVEDLQGMLAQPRAEAALRFGVAMAHPGYNVFALGVAGTGKRHLVLRHLREQAVARPAAPDICYVHNFAAARRPRLLLLPPGQGAALRRDMDRLVEDLRGGITTAFDSEEYHARRKAIDDEFAGRPLTELAAIEARARARGLAILRGPAGLEVAPMRHGEVLTPEQFRALTAEEQKQLEAAIGEAENEMERARRQVTRWGRERRERLRELSREVSGQVVDHCLESVRADYAGLPAVLAHLDALRADAVEHAAQFTESPEPQMLADLLRHPLHEPWSSRYRVNVLVDNAERAGAPVVEEDHPTHDNLMGRIEHLSQFGALVTDFTLLRAGALHRANGGYLVVEADRLLRAPLAWEALKRMLQSGCLRMESFGEALGLTATVSLEPEPLPLDVQVVLLGEPRLYYLLCALDPDFVELFKVAADFADDMPASEEDESRYVHLIATLARQEQLRPFDRGAVARLMDHGARLAGDQQKLSIRMGSVVDLLREADHWAGEAGDGVVGAAHVQRAVDAQIFRADRLRERIFEQIWDGTVLIDTGGERVGQVNALSAVALGRFAFGYPSRVTARVRLGVGDVVDIQREVELGGPIHTKGVLTLAAYLRARYARDLPLSLWASLTLEQAYGPVEGDSAAMAELCAILSAVAEVPLRQGRAVTGAVNQFGEAQAVGGVNEKIEGFFDICAGRGLTGDQGAIIPAANVRHLMLRQDVIAAAASGRFHVWPVATVDQAIELLTGKPPGERDASGRFPEGSVNDRVETRLAAYAERRREFMRSESPAAGRE